VELLFRYSFVLAISKHLITNFQPTHQNAINVTILVLLVKIIRKIPALLVPTQSKFLLDKNWTTNVNVKQVTTTTTLTMFVYNAISGVLLALKMFALLVI